MKVAKNHPENLLLIWAECLVSASELNTGKKVEFKFYQIDWESEGIEEGGIRVCDFRQAGASEKEIIIVEYSTMQLLESTRGLPVGQKKHRLLDNNLWLSDWIASYFREQFLIKYRGEYQ